ncbi:TPA: multidrug efflux transporter outer membrane subunit OprA [Pseudomonas aeruginosa]|uniref:multidrug efflux transporter outer membrane subunit OprA n=1 Tax=Pseudomonas aeruginosa TaxID=287 RepID=UPI000F537F6A|nr:multidrug efflux transporter outer membrane subunit OprA [Pseudomonas aeruginosa]MBU8394601.1 efflux transporter outer membrane subunit [Pseudomonas aeruginosa]MCO2228975.1 efflux transporter outer membrane subunit [Pseudomonas aeruginosa]MCO2234134.1 efflux transporter outer membrane subunit [Pseudomonas aeruginosa]MCO2241174.1 efflux transporter outer membrane subunit [Pseudomonas aeruginosa]MCO2336206.1 efflux transporter outer membrane subunit [Pseudomonas aeruginosa]
MPLSKLSVSTLALCLGLLGACSLAPRYQRPEAPIPTAYPAVPAGQQAADRAKLDDWQQQFTDPVLQQMIGQALEHNRNLRIAALRIEEARALYGVQASERLPTLEASGRYERERLRGEPSEAGQVEQRYRVAAGISAFELDFFGRVKSLGDAALADYLASEEARRSARIALIAEVAGGYVQERALYEQQRLAERTLEARENGLALVRKRYAAGMSTRIDLRSEEMLVESARATLAALVRERSQAVSGLQLLLGDFSADWQERPLDLERFQLQPPAAGLPSELLARRPDIRQAEQQLRAANASIGAARAAFFPSLRLSTDLGSASDGLRGLFKSGSRVWTFSPQLTVPIFDGGRNRANLDLAEVRKDIAVSRYEESIQVAFREVADALVAGDQLDIQLRAQRGVRDADRERLQLVQKRYAKGVANYLEMLDAQRSLFDSEQQLIRLQGLRLNNGVALYRALGGGWQRH